MVNRRLSQELDTRKLLHNNQHAYRPGQGTETYFANLDTVLNNAISKNWHVDCGIIDLAKAFDQTWRHSILAQLDRWGFKGILPIFIENFLQNRTSSVLVLNQPSDTFLLENGVPQGAILSPNLFLISIESLFLSIPDNITPFIYADDIILISTGENFTTSRNNLQLGFNNVRQWCRWTGFQVSPDKCKILHIHKQYTGKLKPIKYNNQIIPNARNARVLGIILDSNLTFIPHFKQLKITLKPCLTVFKMLGCGRYRASRTILLRLLHSWLLPKMLYGSEILSREPISFNKCLAPIYHNALKYSSSAYVTSPTKSILCESGQLPFTHIITLRLLGAAFRCREKDLSCEPLYQRAATAFNTLTSSSLPDITKIPRRTIRT